jgi:carbon monoxide dehydrogenase subunit G
MRIENEFTVAQPLGPLWAYLLDVERIAPCMPGAELTEHVDDTTWKGKVNVAFGPVKLSFAGTVTIRERDDEAHRVTLAAKGMEAKGKGAATANVTSWLEPVDASSTAVHMQADITLTGAAAQLSRGLLPEISKQLTQQFADCLHASMDADGAAQRVPDDTATEDDRPPAPAAGVTASPAHVGGIGLGLKALWSIVTGWFRRLFGRGAPSS